MTRRTARYDLAYQAVLVAGLWLVLRLLGAEISQTVVVTTLAAIFGPGALSGFRRG